MAADGVAASQRAYGRVAAREKSGRGLQVARKKEGKDCVPMRVVCDIKVCESIPTGSLAGGVRGTEWGKRPASGCRV